MIAQAYVRLQLAGLPCVGLAQAGRPKSIFNIFTEDFS